MDELYFDASMEPDDSIFEFKRAVEDVAAAEGVKYISIDCSDKQTYYSTMNLLRNFNNENIHVSATSREDDLTIVVEHSLNMDDKTAVKQERKEREKAAAEARRAAANLKAAEEKK